MASELEPKTTGETPLFPKIEEEIAAYWKKHRIFERSLEERPEKKSYIFYDGPPFATGGPHYGHLLQSIVKDALPRYFTMQGYHVPRVWGWDCHGLPIENLIEKDLKLGSKRDIESYGIDKFNNACRLSVFAYEKEWARYVERIGRWVDFENSYKTMSDDFIESVWWAFSELHKKELVYKGVRVSLYCPRCATPLSNFEIAMGNSYIDRDDPAIYLKFPVDGEEKTFFIAWTTTPWSVPGITGLAVHKDLEYVAARIKATGETFIFAEARQADVVKDLGEVEIVKKYKGPELVGKRFQVPYHFLPVEGDANRVILGAHVTADAGTGIVTTAPAFGEEDLVAAQEAGLPLLFTVDDEGRFIKECGPFAGMRVKEADPVVVEDLKQKGFLLRAESIHHSVPVCWRCSTLLLYKAQPAWFINVTKLKSKMLQTADKIHWHPEHFKDGRFGKGLETAPDWNISRTRFWGSPIPVWECADCGDRTVIGSVAELKKKAKPETWPEQVDLHRPGIDQVVLPCSCGKEQKRIPEVFDCWVESGSMPFASIHYPFENRAWFDEHFPADFIAEGQDQTRGWFYTLHVMAAALFGKPAFKDVMVTGLMLAEDGKKMSKSLKNYPDPWHVLTTYGADAMRFYILSSPVTEAESLNFSERDLQTMARGVVNILWNVKVFYETYAREGVRLEKPRSAHVLDRWLFARLMQLSREVETAMESYAVMHAVRPIRAFIDDLSTWWLRRSRERLKSDNAFERQDALKTLREVLEELAKIIAPFMPFIAEKIYLDIGGLKASVHLEKWPTSEERLIDERLLSDMQWVRDAASKTHEARTVAKMAVRQALAKVTIRMKDADTVSRLQKQHDLTSLLRDEVNVELVEVLADTSLSEPFSVVLDTELTPELKRKGWVREFSRHVMNLRKEAKTSPQDHIRLSVSVSDAELREAIEGAKTELAKDLKADEMLFTDAEPSDVRAKSEVKIDGRRIHLFLT